MMIYDTHDRRRMRWNKLFDRIIDNESVVLIERNSRLLFRLNFKKFNGKKITIVKV